MKFSKRIVRVGADVGFEGVDSFGVSSGTASEPNGSRVRMIVVFASVPLRRLVELSGYRKRRWSFEDGWLILEAF
jgi:hypothetical protein